MHEATVKLVCFPVALHRFCLLRLKNDLHICTPDLSIISEVIFLLFFVFFVQFFSGWFQVRD